MARPLSSGSEARRMEATLHPVASRVGLGVTTFVARGVLTSPFASFARPTGRRSMSCGRH